MAPIIGQCGFRVLTLHFYPQSYIFLLCHIVCIVNMYIYIYIYILYIYIYIYIYIYTHYVCMVEINHYHTITLNMLPAASVPADLYAWTF